MLPWIRIALPVDTWKIVEGPAPRKVIDFRISMRLSIRYLPAGTYTTWPLGHLSIALWIAATALAEPVLLAPYGA